MSRTRFQVEIFLVSLALILLEISYTRIFSYKLFYYFTYLVIGISLLGIGAGGVVVALFTRLRTLSPERLIPASCFLAALCVPLGYLVVASLQLDTTQLSVRPLEILKLAALCLSVFLPFLFAGVVIATVFGAAPGEIHRLYFADLLGAGLGCALCVPLLIVLTPPGTVWLAGAALALAGLRLAGGVGRMPALAFTLLGAGLFAAAVLPENLPDPVPDPTKTMSPQKLEGSDVLFSRWHPVFRVDVVNSLGTESQRYYLHHDGMLGSSVLGFDGDLDSVDRFARDVRSLPFALPLREPKVLIIGSAGGHEILASLAQGAAHVTGVELNPVTVSLLREHFADFSGRIAHHEKVTLVNSEGRTFLERDRDRYDLIWFVAPDSYAAMNAASSGAFVLSESYLYTREMITEALAHLSERGVVCVQFGEINFTGKPNRTTRYLATARAAFEDLGESDFARHVLLATTPEFFTMSTILLKRTPFAEADVAAFRSGVARLPGSSVWIPATEQRHPVQKVATLSREELARFFDEYPYDVTAVSDDSPFFWHFASFEDALAREWGGAGDVIWDPEDATGERVLVVLLGVVAALSAVFLLLPLLAARAVWRAIPYKRYAFVYFAALGLGFMFFEVCLIQQLTLLLGYPTYSLTVTLFGLLVFTGVGSLLTGRYAEHGPRALRGLLLALVLLLAWYFVGMRYVVSAFVGAPLAARVVLAVLFLAPVGLTLGAFMPIGLSTIARVTVHPREYVAWAWAVNGFFSVLASILATMLSMSFGFRVVLLLAGIVYVTGILALQRIPAARPSGV